MEIEVYRVVQLLIFKNRIAMEIKKTRKASLENKKKSIFLFGLLTSLGLLLMAFEWSNYDVNYTLPTMEVGVLIEHEPVLEDVEILRPKPVKSQPVTHYKNDY